MNQSHKGNLFAACGKRVQSQIHMPFSLKQSKKPTIFRQVSEAHHHQRSLSSSSTSSETCSGSFIFSTFVFEGLRVNEARKQETILASESMLKLP